MLGLLVCSSLTIAIVVERLLYLAQQHVDAEALVRQLGDRLALGDLRGAIAVCDQNRGLLPRILKGGLLRRVGDRAGIDDGFTIVAKRYLPALDRNLAIIGTIAVIAPFVGLFGTVLGIIHAFDDIALKGNSSPAVVAAGVSEALVTTAGGLFVAILSVIFFNYFKSRVRTFREEIGWAIDEVVEMLLLHQRGDLVAADVARLIDETGLPATTAGAA